MVWCPGGHGQGMVVALAQSDTVSKSGAPSSSMEALSRAVGDSGNTEVYDRSLSEMHDALGHEDPSESAHQG